MRGGTEREAGCRFRQGARAGGFLAVLGLVALFCGCGHRPGQGPEREAQWPPGLKRAPIVLLPGVNREVGHVLRGGSFASFSALALRTDGEALAHLGDPRFPAGGADPLGIPPRLNAALRGTNVRGLQPLINRLIRDQGYVRGNPDNPRDKDYPENPEAERHDRARPASLFVLYYDWRRDLAASACVVAEEIARIRETAGAPRVLVVGHSLGGLVARYYLRYGGEDVLDGRSCPLAQGAPAASLNQPGARSVAGLVTLGAPNRGSALALQALTEDFRLFGIFELGLRRAVFSMPMAWELLPFAGPDGQVSVLVTDGRAARVPLFQLRTWIDRGWLPGEDDGPDQVRFASAMLERAGKLQQALAGPDAAEEAVPRLLVGSDCWPTPVGAVVTDGGLKFPARNQAGDPFYARAVAPGDGIVTSASALDLPASPGLSTLTVCSRHNGYVDHPEVEARVARFLSAEGTAVTAGDDAGGAARRLVR